MLVAAQLVIALDYSIVNVALPEIGRVLGFTNGTVQWVISADAVTFGGFLLLSWRAAALGGRGSALTGASPGVLTGALHSVFTAQAGIALLGAAVALVVIGNGRRRRYRGPDRPHRRMNHERTDRDVSITTTWRHG